ncbi:flagellar assembly protein FliW [Aminipila luticellarii]|uniref:Flagellar assembly factor FliW n=1 Tax=Aminipila luticellarii TaxID=2507160 RepID=A0A410PSQ7_9FIRM|nr:flagellar assembly protein FliW [Aminipila luticellarii]QAT42021.1 flagellar assembly protein FliW [Aminipila luticellarii]
MNTRYFGDVPVDEKEIITFDSGIFGFEDKTKYMLLSFLDESGESSEDLFMCLQSTEDPDLAFIVMNPYFICADYNPYQMDEKFLSEIHLGQQTKHTVYCIAVVRDRFEDSTINLKCPIIINLENRQAKQFILEDSDYSMRHPVAERED